MLAAQAMRAVRVIVDIGMHLELPIPPDEAYHPGERWTADLARPFMIERSIFPPTSWPRKSTGTSVCPAKPSPTRSASGSGSSADGQAKDRKGAAFDLKDFHRYALDLGDMGLDQLSRELQRY